MSRDEVKAVRAGHPGRLVAACRNRYCFNEVREVRRAQQRLTIAVHALTWIGLCQRRAHEVATSEQSATSVNTNPVVVRSLLAGQRKAGPADSRRGAGADWTLSRDLREITLPDAYEAVEAGPMSALHRST